MPVEIEVVPLVVAVVAAVVVVATAVPVAVVVGLIQFRSPRLLLLLRL